VLTTEDPTLWKTSLVSLEPPPKVEKVEVDPLEYPCESPDQPSAYKRKIAAVFLTQPDNNRNNDDADDDFYTPYKTTENVGNGGYAFDAFGLPVLTSVCETVRFVESRPTFDAHCLRENCTRNFQGNTAQLKCRPPGTFLTISQYLPVQFRLFSAVFYGMSDAEAEVLIQSSVQRCDVAKSNPTLRYPQPDCTSVPFYW
jgi:hypothetical protein